MAEYRDMGASNNNEEIQFNPGAEQINSRTSTSDVKSNISQKTTVKL